MNSRRDVNLRHSLGSGIVPEDMRADAPVDPGAPRRRADRHSDALQLDPLVGPHCGRKSQSFGLSCRQ
jgi:hypothetical protein